MELTLTLLTAGLSAAIAAYVAYRVNEDRDARSFRGGKAEELYRVAETLDRELARFFDPRCAVADSNRQLNVAGDDPLPIVAARLADAKMLVGFYFPQLSTALARCIAAVATAHASLRLWEEAGDAADRDGLLDGFDRDVVAAKDAIEGFKAAIIDSGRAASQPRWPFARRRSAAAPSRALRVA